MEGRFGRPQGGVYGLVRAVEGGVTGADALYLCFGVVIPGHSAVKLDVLWHVYHDDEIYQCFLAGFEKQW